MLDEWVAKSSTAGVRKRLWQSRHLLKIAQTQSLGKRIDSGMLQAATQIQRVASLDAHLRLRKLQHRIIQYLYRPTGSLVRKFALTVQKDLES